MKFHSYPCQRLLVTNLLKMIEQAGIWHILESLHYKIRKTNFDKSAFDYNLNKLRQCFGFYNLLLDNGLAIKLIIYRET